MSAADSSQSRPRGTRSLLARAISALARREHSRRSLAQKLAAHAESREELEALLNELETKGLLSDERFAHALVRHRGERLGSARLRHELAESGVSEEVAEQALLAARETEVQRAFRVWSKRFGAAPGDAQERLKQMRFLHARGFGPETYRQLERVDFQPEDLDSH
ncbi:MAG: recombination regulator RecX [Betaproteobacteria bacterium]|nr:recombination regulator RecX [Betaproteobacteria bacterium]